MIRHDICSATYSIDRDAQRSGERTIRLPASTDYALRIAPRDCAALTRDYPFRSLKSGYHSVFVSSRFERGRHMHRWMSGNTRGSIWVRIFFVVTVGALCVAIYQIVWTFCGRQSPDFGTAIGELLLVIVLGVGEILAFFALRHTAQQREFDWWIKALEIWMDADFGEERGRLFRRLQNPNLPWAPPDRNEAMEVIRKMDGFARIVPYLGTEKVLDTFDDPIAKAWIVLEPVVLEERTKNANWPKKWEAFAQIGREALAKLVNENRDPRMSNRTDSPSLPG